MLCSRRFPARKLASAVVDTTTLPEPVQTRRTHRKLIRRPSKLAVVVESSQNCSLPPVEYYASLLSSFHDEYRPFLGYTMQGVLETGGLFSEDWLEKVFENIFKVRDSVKSVLERKWVEKRDVVKVGLGSEVIAV